MLRMHIQTMTDTDIVMEGIATIIIIIIIIITIIIIVTITTAVRKAGAGLRER